VKAFLQILRILIILLTLAQTAFAQGEDEKDEEDAGILDMIPKPKMFGIRGGVQLTATGPYDWSFGFHAGAVVDIVKLTDFDLLGNHHSIYVQPGFYFLTRQSLWKKDPYWFEIPILLSIRQQQQKKPKASKRLNTAYRFELGPYVNTGHENKDGKKQMSREDIGVSLVAGYELGMVWIYSSYNRGFVKTSDYKDNSTSCWKILGIGVNF
jgi:hypothetical protein